MFGAAVVIALSACTGDTGDSGPSNDSQPRGAETSSTTTAPPTSATEPQQDPSGWRSIAPAPIEGRSAAGAVWSGEEMIVWGGGRRGTNPEPGEQSDGAAYDPATDSWRILAPAPEGVLGFPEASVWTGDAALFWVGNSPDGPAAGALYDPESDSWERIPDGPLGPREGAASVWTGSELVLIGGTTGDQLARPVAAAFDPSEGSWRQLAALDDLFGLSAGAVWTGDEVLMVGGLYLCPELGSVCTDSRPIMLSLDVASDAVTEIDVSGTPAEDRIVGLVGWAGSEAILRTYENPAVGVKRFDPGSSVWRDGPSSLCEVETEAPHQSVFLDDRLAVPCGSSRLQIYDADSDTWGISESGPSPLHARVSSAIVWTGTELIVWGGQQADPEDPNPNDGAILSIPPE